MNIPQIFRDSSIFKKNSIGRLLILIPLVLLFLGNTYSVKSQANRRTTNIDIPLSRSVPVSPCPGESLQLSGAMHLLVETTVDENSRRTHKPLFNELRDVKGTGQTSQSIYRFDSAAREPQSHPCGAGQQCIMMVLSDFTISGSGPDNNLSGKIIVFVSETPDGGLKADVVEFRFTCQQ